jgi:hypothetical protein
MTRVVGTRPDIACAVRKLTFSDQLALTIEVLRDWEATEPDLPANVIPFRRPRARYGLA